MNPDHPPSGTVVRLTDLTAPAALAARAALTTIFFESSSRTTFDSEGERQAFFDRWATPYLRNYPEDVWLWREEDGTVSAYLTGCRDSAAAAGIYAALPHYAVFEPWFSVFPAHLHVNCRHDRRNLGIGARLIDAFITDCRQAGQVGVHIVTAPEARNVRFYDRIGFGERITGAYVGRPLLLMGRRLTAETGA